MRGFTLVELLVVIAIMGILGTLGFIYSRTFQTTQVLNEGVSLIVSSLRTAQANATAGLKCQGMGGATWLLTFENNTTFNLKCKVGAAAALTQRSYILPTNVQVFSISGSSCDASHPISVNFSPLFGVISFESSDLCVPKRSAFDIRVINTKTKETKNVTITKGGAIDAQ